MNPIDPRRSERDLLAALVHWARTNGWRSGGRGWENPARTFAIEPRDGEVVIWWLSTGRAPWPQSALSSCRYILADSITQAIDLLVVYGYLPPMWSSAYALAEEKYRDEIETYAEELRRAQGAYRDVVAGWAERAGLPAVGARIDPEDPPQWAIDRRHAGTGVPDDAPDAPPEWVVALLPDVDWVGGERQ